MSEINFPSDWVACSISDVAQVNPKKIDAEPDTISGFIPMALAPASFSDSLRYEEKHWKEIKKSYTNFQNGDVIFAKVTPCFENGKAAIVDGLPNGIGAGSSEFYVLRPHTPYVLPEILFALIKTQKFANDGAANMTGAVGLRRVPRAFVESFDVPMIPMAEQKVIAEKLDTLLAQVEATKTRLESTLETLKQFRQSVLAAAVSGKLTEDWRSENPSLDSIELSEVGAYWTEQYKISGKRLPKLKLHETEALDGLPDTWLDTKIGHVFDVHVGATPSRSNNDYWGGCINWVSSSEVAFCRISSTKETITESGLNNTSTNLHPPGTVMLAMIGQGKTRGQAAILDIEACHNQNTAALRVPEGFAVSEFLYFFLTKQYEETRRVGGGNNQKALNKSFVQSLPFPLPPIEEQKEIVKCVEKLFAGADATEQQVNQALERVNNLTQSILAKAFRGELTEQWRKENPGLISGENSAEALLKKIKAERAAAKPKRKARTTSA
ncbi:restriction endonuclease subunit S [Vibrio vulnificus]|uniref:restriction endonuclease subunit S n=1 Tax=Vibrio vulnificus TaxID=672 RepID=UPI001028ABC2|nr:restriction endonuclease subunit S [Vibrio vulnificus]EIZ1360309.1 restriction endonuclease subunit S [Vibrio vulnificus]RZR20712.1 type I restriction endonuclease subunit S [Vibrio vulnificus]